MSETDNPTVKPGAADGDSLGLLWLGNRPKGRLTIEDLDLPSAIRAFRRRFPGRRPVLIEVPMTVLDKEYSNDGLTVKPCRTCPGRLVKLW